MEKYLDQEKKLDELNMQLNYKNDELQKRLEQLKQNKHSEPLKFDALINQEDNFDDLELESQDECQFLQKDIIEEIQDIKQEEAFKIKKKVERLEKQLMDKELEFNSLSVLNTGLNKENERLR